ncbi:MAG: macro domain-containing protein [Chloroflexi bacterium]|nr:macro domain-containing protein [Chloroflexota bacterium]
MAEWLALKGWHLSSGGAQGADSAFARGAPQDSRSVYLPWKDYNHLADPSCIPLTSSQLSACMDVARPLHPAWNRCSPTARKLHARNAAILLGADLHRPVNAVIAWTKGGAVTGGTGMALRIAEQYDIPTFNLCTISPREICEGMLAIKALQEQHAHDLRFTPGDIFDQSAQAIVNPVNCVGVMGRGLALEFKRRYPAAFAAYRDACADQRLKPGRVFLYDTGEQQPRWIVHFPTKRHWRDASIISDIEAGLIDLTSAIKRHDIKSIALPPLGCGLGGLDWQDVRPLITSHLASTPAAVTVLEPRAHTRAVTTEHQSAEDPQSIPTSAGKAAEPAATQTADSRGQVPDLQTLQRDWQLHLAQAKAAHVHPFFLPGHQHLIERLQAVQNHPDAPSLPARQRDQIRTILEHAARHTEIVADVRNHLRELRTCRTTLAELRHLADTYGLDLSRVHSFDTWHSEAQRLLTASHSIAESDSAYARILNHDPKVWTDLHDGIRDLSPALGADTTSFYHRQPELYLQPIAPPHSSSDHSIRTHAAFCQLREKWQAHLALAQTQESHPYRVGGLSGHIQQLKDLRRNPHLDAAAASALDALIGHHARAEKAQLQIDGYLSGADDALQTQQANQNVRREYAAANAPLPIDNSLAEWQDEARSLIKGGRGLLEQLTPDAVLLEDTSDVRTRLEHTLQRLGRSIAGDHSAIPRGQHHSLAEDPELSRDESAHESIKL